jgi:serine/threonine protein kinase
VSVFVYVCVCVCVASFQFRAPEEYNYIPETAAIDVWALGSIFVELLTGHGPWHGYDLKKAQNLIAKGNLPPLADEIKNSSYPVDQVLQKAIELCYVFEPKDRPKAGVVVDFLKTEAEKLGIDWHAPFEVDE